VQHYLKSGDSLRKTAQKFHVGYPTVFKWVKLYKEQGEQRLLSTYRRPWNRPSKETEQQIVLLKENNPCLALAKTKNILQKNGIKMSIHGIWCIWKRYNLVGFHRRNVGQVETDSEIADAQKKVEQAMNDGDTKQAARILNALPLCAGKDILKRIPDRFLSLPRRVEKLNFTFGKIPFPETMRKAKILRERAENKALFYTSIRAGLVELFAMETIGNPEKQLILAQRLLDRLKKKDSPNNAEPALHFYLLIGKGRALAGIGKTKEVLSNIKKCENLCCYLKEPIFYRNIASIYSAIGFHKKSRCWIKKSLECEEDTQRGSVYVYLAGNLTIAGEYRAARKVLKGIKVDKSGFLSLSAIINAYCFLGEGKIQDAVRCAKESLLTSRKEEILGYIITSFLALAYCSCALNKAKEAMVHIKRLISITKRLRTKNTFCSVLLGQISFSHDAILMPNIKLALLLRQASESLKIKDYRRAFNYASSQQLMGLFHRLVLFFPESVNKLIAMGKPTGLPKALWKLPVFQKNIPVYHLQFLGPVHIYRSNVRLRNHLTPMYAGLLIHLGLKKKIELESLYRNLWLHSENPRDLLSHLLFGLRRYLRLPPNTLFVKSGYLNLKGYITIDYQEFEQIITRAKALERAGEWGFAKKEYLRAFKLFRGEPFRKMYDPWSENMRRVILNNLETEALHFAKSCMERGNKTDAKRVLDKVAKIIPQSEETRKMVRECGCRNGNDL
jgi:transposase/tetratricopeptide (TPR) repeat protein